MSCGHDGCTCGTGDEKHDHSDAECCGGHRRHESEEKVGAPTRRPE